MYHLKAMDVIVFGGGREIGGTKIQLKVPSGEFIFLDFGKSFKQEKFYFSEPYLVPKGPYQLKYFNILPKVEGLYLGDSQENNGCLGVLISHPHSDHYEYARYLKRDIPIYAHRTCIATIRSRDEIDVTVKKDYRFFIEREFERKDRFYPLESGVPVKIGPFRIEAFEVDHSAPGAVSFLIEAGGKTVVYTGDIRFHGRNAWLSEKFVESVKGIDVDLLITEGTHAEKTSPGSEEEVYQKILKTVGKSEGLVLAHFSITDLSRFETFLKVSRATGRKLIIGLKLFKLLYDLSCREKVLENHREIANFDGIYLYKKQKDVEYVWEKELSEIARNSGLQIIQAEELAEAEKQKSSILVLNFYDFNELTYIKPISGSIFILSQSEPFDEEGVIDFEKLKNWLEFMGLPMFSIHCSGHADPFSLKRIIETLSPAKTLIVHSERPETLSNFVDKTRYTLIPATNGLEISA